MRGEVYQQKFFFLPDMIRNWVSELCPLHGAEILDFGCGEANTALGITLRFHEQLGLEVPPDNLTLRRVSAGALHDPLDLLSAYLSGNT
jgi:hypothetical protein